MHYVIIGNHTYHCIRFTGKGPDWADEEGPDGGKRYEFDDEVT